MSSSFILTDIISHRLAGAIGLRGEKMTKKNILFSLLIFGLLLGLGLSSVPAENSLFTRTIANSPFVQELFAYVEQNEEAIIAEWRGLTEIPAPSGYEEKRAQYMKVQFDSAGLDKIYIDEAGNVIGIWEGRDGGKKISGCLGYSSDTGRQCAESSRNWG